MEESHTLCPKVAKHPQRQSRSKFPNSNDVAKKCQIQTIYRLDRACCNYRPPKFDWEKLLEAQKGGTTSHRISPLFLLSSPKNAQNSVNFLANVFYYHSHKVWYTNSIFWKFNFLKSNFLKMQFSENQFSENAIFWNPIFWKSIFWKSNFLKQKSNFPKIQFSEIQFSENPIFRKTIFWKKQFSENIREKYDFWVKRPSIVFFLTPKCLVLGVSMVFQNLASHHFSEINGR